MREDTPKKDKSSSASGGSVWLKAVKWTGIAVGIVVLLAVVLITVAVSYLQPERLTPLVEKMANESLDARVKVGRAELSFWSTFPRLEIDVDTIEVLSKALDPLPATVRESLPQGADSLLFVRHMHAAVNIPAIVAMKFKIYDVDIDETRVRLVQATPDVANFDIAKPTEEAKPKSDEPLTLPDIVLGSFRLRDGFNVRYTSLPDTIDANVSLTAGIDGAEHPDYKVDISGTANASLTAFTIPPLGIGSEGTLTWSHEKPLHIRMSDFAIYAGDVRVKINADMDFGSPLRIDALKVELPSTQVGAILALIPKEMLGDVAGAQIDACMAAAIELTEPYLPESNPIPSVRATLEIPEGHGSYDNMTLDRLCLKVGADIVGNDPNSSVLTLSRLLAQGEGMGFELVGEVTSPLINPRAKGTFRGGLDIASLPKQLIGMLPMKLSGRLHANMAFDVRQNDLNRENFHRISLNGDADLSQFHASMPELPLEVYMRQTNLKFGTDSKFSRGNFSADSLLTVSLKIDTLSADVTGMILRASDFSAGIGCSNRAASADTSQIIPIGGKISAGRLYFKSSEDSMRVHLRKASIAASLTRFKEMKKKPQLRLHIATDRAFYGDRINRAMLREANLFVTVHPSVFKPSARSQQRLDSLAALNPGVPRDSLRRMIFAQAAARRAAMGALDSLAVENGEAFDIGLDNNIRNLLRQWNASGVLRAKRAGAFTPYFPLRNSISDLTMTFCSDSVTISDTRFRTGHSEMTVNGTIGNITRALTSRTHRVPLTVNFNLTGDTIDINEIAAGVFAGAAFAESDTTGIYVAADTDDPESAQEAMAKATTEPDTTSVLVIPSNVKAVLNIKADNVIYSNLVFHDFMGNISVADGSLNISKMGARSDVGSISLNALYAAPKKEEAFFAFGMLVKELNIKQFLNLMPALDSIMPLLQDFQGVINADVAAASDIGPGMMLEMPTLKAAVKLSGDSLVLIDAETFRRIGKWLLFKHKERNVIDHMAVEMLVDSSRLQIFPFMFDIDRYKLGVMGSNDMALNLNYHIAVLKSPIPFKFGINIKGNIDKYKIRLGRAKFSEKSMPKTVAIADTARINLVREIGNVFRRGVRNSDKRQMLNFKNVGGITPAEIDEQADTISRADSLYFIREGLIAAPDSTASPALDKQ